MSIVIISDRDPKAWLSALKSKATEVEVSVYPEVRDKSKVDYALVWNYPHGVLTEFPNLKVVASMGAGVDHILSDPELPKDVLVTRVVDVQLGIDMAEFVLAVVLSHLRNLLLHKGTEPGKQWQPRPYLRISDPKIGIMGMGILGNRVAEKLKSAGFNVIGWARTQRSNRDFGIFSGKEELESFLSEIHILVCLLPLTPVTENILNKDLFSKLPRNAFVINVARGKHLVEKDLLEYLDNGHLSGAALDVFRTEPLPEDHPFWEHPKVHVTPHIASVSRPASVVGQVLENYRRLQNEQPLGNTVEVAKGY